MVCVNKDMLRTKVYSTPRNFLQICGKCFCAHSGNASVSLPIVAVVHAKLNNQDICRVRLNVLWYPLQRQTRCTSVYG